jgi:hypothetical protein
MTNFQPDSRSEDRKLQDEQIAAEPPLPPPSVPDGTQPGPLEGYLHKVRKPPVAVLGVVENGLVRPLDPEVKLTEHARVIIVASGSV